MVACALYALGEAAARCVMLEACEAADWAAEERDEAIWSVAADGDGTWLRSVEEREEALDDIALSSDEEDDEAV